MPTSPRHQPDPQGFYVVESPSGAKVEPSPFAWAVEARPRGKTH